MTGKCLDEAVIQAYTDGELEAEAAHAAAGHFAQCEACAEALASAEGENLFFAEAFGPAAEIAVPSEVLRARVNAAVARLEDSARVDERGAGWNFGAFAASLNGLFSFTPRRAAAFASVLAVVVAGLVFYSVQRRTNPSADKQNEVARAEQPTRPSEPNTTPGPQPGEEGKEGKGGAVPSEIVTAPTPPLVKVSAPRSQKRRAAPANRALVTPKADAPLPGEEKYQEVIASLEKVVKLGGEGVLAPQARFEYERNIAVLDRAIEETRRVARRDPKDRDAIGFLMSAYQSKVELLSTVADQTQVASVGR